MTRPLKKAGFSQGIYAINATQKEELGTMRILSDGRIFRYAKAGASALAAGKMGVAPAIAADVMNEACANAHAIGDYVIEETITSAAADYAENHFQGGYLQINDATGEGHQYKIQSSTAVATGGTSICLTLEDPIRVALVAATSEFTIAKSPWQGVTESTTEESLPVGIAPRVVTAAYYYWAQTHGPALALVAGTPAVGSMLTLSSTAGALAAINATLDIDQPICAISWGTVGVSGEYKPVFLRID